MATILMLGPQRLEPTLRTHVESLGLTAPLAAITAGWQETEGEIAELERVLDSAVLPLGLYRRTERVFDEDPELFRAHRDRQRRLRELQRIYRRRLDHALDAHRELAGLAREIESSEGDTLLEGEIEAALEAVRALDRHHLEGVARIVADYRRELRPDSRPAVARHRDEVAQGVADSSAVLIAGGHVAILLNRMRLFDLGELLVGKPILAWSAGAMVLASRIVLFHDSPPWGAGNAEVLDDGLGLTPGVQPLPHARGRLRLDDPARVSLFARRFAPARCIGFDAGSWLRIDESARNSYGPWSAGGVQLLLPDGEVESVAPESPEVLAP